MKIKQILLILILKLFIIKIHTLNYKEDKERNTYIRSTLKQIIGELYYFASEIIMSLKPDSTYSSSSDSSIEIKNPYRVLGVAPYNSMTYIKKVYKDLVLLTHPDKCKEDCENAKKRFYDVQEAYKEIKNVKEKGNGGEYSNGLGSILYKIFFDSSEYNFLLIVLFYALYWIYKFLENIFDYLFYSIIFYFVIEHLFTNIIDDFEDQLKASMVLSIALVLFISYKKSNNVENNIQNNENTDTDNTGDNVNNSQTGQSALIKDSSENDLDAGHTSTDNYLEDYKASKTKKEKVNEKTKEKDEEGS